MPEIGEVARIVHYLRKHLVNRTIKSCQAFEDDIVYGKVGTSATAFQSAVTGKRVTGAGQQGKYFYLTFDSAPHAVMHLGMTGWIKFSAEETGYYRQAKEKEVKEEWPPKYMKFLLKCEKEKVEGEQRDPVEVAFVDGRRLARIRLVDCKAAEIRRASPLKENGPDPVIDREILTVDFLTTLMRKKRVPVKALLLDQANISGVGNWVADEILYQARIHPEQYSNTFDDDQIKTLHESLMDVCTTACDLLADSTRFPENWLMKYRWDKGKKDSNVLPNGNKIVHLKVGGRTSAIVPAVQKKTAAVAGDVNESDLEDADETKAITKAAPKARKRKAKAEEAATSEDEAEPEKPAPAVKRQRGSKDAANDAVEPSESNKKASKKRETKKSVKGGTTAEVKAELDDQSSAPSKENKQSTKPTQKAVTQGTRASTRTRTSGKV